VKVHARQRAGDRRRPSTTTIEETAYALRHPDRIIRAAATLGPNVETFAQNLFEGPLPWAKLRQGQKPLSVGENYTATRLDAATSSLSFAGSSSVGRYRLCPTVSLWRVSRSSTMPPPYTS